VNSCPQPSVEFPKIQQAPPLGRLVRTAIIAQLLMLVSEERALTVFAAGLRATAVIRRPDVALSVAQNIGVIIHSVAGDRAVEQIAKPARIKRFGSAMLLRTESE